MFFVFTNEAQKAAIMFRVFFPRPLAKPFSRTRGPRPAYRSAPPGSTRTRKGNFSAPGTYWAEVYGTKANKSQLIAAIPLPFAAPKQTGSPAGTLIIILVSSHSLRFTSGSALVLAPRCPPAVFGPR